MLMKDSTVVSNQCCMPVNLLIGAILCDPCLPSRWSKVIKYKYVKHSNKS